MKTDSLKQYVTLRQSLLAEKNQLEARLAAINEALGEASKAAAAVKVAKVAKVAKVSGVTPTGKPRRKNKISAAGRAAIIAAQKARWAKLKAGKKS